MSDFHHHDEFRLNTPEFNELNKRLDRRNFLTRTSLGIGALAVGSLFGNSLFGGASKAEVAATGDLEADILRALPHFAPKAKRVVYLFQSGGPSQFETFDYKPMLSKMMG